MAYSILNENPEEKKGAIQSPKDLNSVRKLKTVRSKYQNTILIVAGLTLSTSINAQTQDVKIDYTAKSNFINPDTLKGDQKLIFYHFKNETSEDLKTMEAQKIKAEFAKLGLRTKEKDRFIKAYSFFVNTLEGHKKSCENWEEFKYLKPEEDK